MIEAFAEDGHYANYAAESGASTVVNAHVLAAIAANPGYPDRLGRMRMILGHLKRARGQCDHWYDKWHIYPYYATGHTLASLRDLPAPLHAAAAQLARPALRWLRTSQQQDGGWGAFGATTAEETAYALLGALTWPEHMPDVRTLAGDAVRRLERWNGAERPALWIGKCAYHPPRIVTAAVHAARYRACAFLGGTPELPEDADDLLTAG